VILNGQMLSGETAEVGLLDVVPRFVQLLPVLPLPMHGLPEHLRNERSQPIVLELALSVHPTFFKDLRIFFCRLARGLTLQ
jgi:hypothetical protein